MQLPAATAIHPWTVEGSGPGLILPDGCLDVIVLPDGEVVAAGPDPVAREHRAAGRYHGIRFSHGLGPALLGVPADELTGRTVAVTDLVGTGPEVAGDPAAALRTWVRSRLAAAQVEPSWAGFVFEAAAAGVPVAAVADRLGLSA